MRKLTAGEKGTVEKFLARVTPNLKAYESDAARRQDPETGKLAEKVVRIGKPAVPRIIEAIGYGPENLYGKQKYGYHPHYWQIVVLTRIGGKKAVNGLIKILEYKYTRRPSGYIGWSLYFESDRKMAAEALVALGTGKTAVPHMEKVIEEMKNEPNIPEVKRRLEKMGEPFRNLALSSLEKNISFLEERLSELKTGKGKRDTSNFPYMPGIEEVSTEKRKEIRQLMKKIEDLKFWGPGNEETGELDDPKAAWEIKNALFELTAATGEGYNGCVKLGEQVTNRNIGVAQVEKGE